MSFSINNVCSSKSYDSLTTSESRRENKDTQELQKKRQIISQKEGEYYSTYIVDEEGQKVLVNKIPIDQVEKKKILQSSIQSDGTKSCDYNIMKNADTDFECKQQLYMEASHRKNVQEIMDILKGNVGIPKNSKKSII